MEGYSILRVRTTKNSRLQGRENAQLSLSFYRYGEEKTVHLLRLSRVVGPEQDTPQRRIRLSLDTGLNPKPETLNPKTLNPKP